MTEQEFNELWYNLFEDVKALVEDASALNDAVESMLPPFHPSIAYAIGEENLDAMTNTIYTAAVAKYRSLQLAALLSEDADDDEKLEVIQEMKEFYIRHALDSSKS